MEILREVGVLKLNKGSLMANGLCNISSNVDDRLSLWLDEETKNELLDCDDESFIEKCETILAYSFVN
jgi:hypothetical protein